MYVTTKARGLRMPVAAQRMKKADIVQVARAAGVSMTTVSRVLNKVPTVTPDNVRRVVLAIKQLNYRPNPSAQRLAAGRSNTVGVIIPKFEGMFRSYYTLETLKGLGMGAERAGCVLLLQIAGSRAALNPSAVDGIVFLDIDGNEELVDQAVNEELACVVLNHYMPDLPVSCVAIDNRMAAQRVVEYLAGLGHQEIATITGDLKTQAGLDRLDGFVTAMKQRRLPVKDGYVQQARWRVDVARDAMEALLKRSDRPTAVFVASDEMAIEAVNTALAKGVRVPEELSIVGFDDNPVAAHARVPLTTIRQPLEEMGRVGIDMLFQQIRGKKRTPTKLLLPTELVERQSCRQTWLERQ